MTTPGEGAVALAFTEEMKGFLDFEESDHRRAFRAGEAAGRRLMFRVTISTDDIERFLEDEHYPARVAGWVRCDALGGLLDVEHGEFNLVVDGDQRRMDYRLEFRDLADAPLTLTGFKEIRHAPGCDLWSDMSTLFARIHAGHAADAPIVATAILQIHPNDFAKQLTSFRVSPPLRLDALARFGTLFAGDLWDAYR
jgi:cholesterol oxidase